METLGKTLGRILPEMGRGQTTAQSLPSTAKWDWTVSLANPGAMTIAQARQIAAAPLPVLVACSEQHFDQCLRILLANLPKRNSDDLSGDLLIRAYTGKLGGFSKEQINYLTDRALERCDWFPTIAQCLSIIAEWKRDDDALRLQEKAKSFVLWERQARFDEMMGRLAAGAVGQDEIDALPDQWKAVGETRSYLRLTDGGRYVSRIDADGKPIPVAAPATEAGDTRRAAPACRKCQDIGRILDLEGNEVDCPECAPPGLKEAVE